MKLSTNIILSLLFICPIAQGALLLTVDSSTKTISWSGSSVTSENIFIPNASNLVYFLANQETTNPNPSPLKVVSGSAGSLTSSVSPTPTGSPNFYTTGSEGAINTTESLGLISVNLGNYITFAGDRNVAFTADVNSLSPMSYSDFNAAEANFLEGLNGTDLFFVDRSNGNFVNTAGGGPAITLQVIPEPSSMALLSLACFGTLLRRTR